MTGSQPRDSSGDIVRSRAWAGCPSEMTSWFTRSTGSPQQLCSEIQALLSWHGDIKHSRHCGQGPKLEMYGPASVSRAFLWWGWGGRPWVRIESSGDTEVKVKRAQSCSTLCHPVDYTVHGLLQARILEWVDFHFFRVSSNSGIKLQSPTLQADSLPAEPHIARGQSQMGTTSSLALGGPDFSPQLNPHDPLVTLYQDPLGGIRTSWST